MAEPRLIYCCECQREVKAKLTSGEEIYPHRSDLFKLPFWICDVCDNYVGCHHKTKDPTRPLGVIPNDEIRNARSHIHRVLDPIWKSGKVKRSELYRWIKQRIGKTYHTGEIRTVEEARKVYRIVVSIRKSLEK